MSDNNIDEATVRGFGEEWSRFTQTSLAESEQAQIFHSYFSLINWTPKPGRCLDFGCGSGRWARMVAPLVEELVAADASVDALAVARANIQAENVTFVHAAPDTLPFPDDYFDLVFSLGVLHHIPRTQDAIKSLARKLQPGGTILLYLYYAFDNRPWWFRSIWKISELGRRRICRLPFRLRSAVCEAIALTIYLPLARVAKHLPVPDSWPLKAYANLSFYTMRTDALDRFGTRLEQRFTREQITAMLTASGLEEIRFSDIGHPWVCSARKP